MGCDIHAYVEEKVEGSWHMLHPIDALGDDRDYTFFTHLCGVRSGFNEEDHSEWPEPKGLPEDTSVMVDRQSDRWGCDGHSHSYESAKDFVEKKLAIGRLHKPSELVGGGFSWHTWKILGYEISDTENPEDFRVVFWFDN
jgi:hypothetical protein